MTEPYTDFKAGELTPWQDLSRKVKAYEEILAELTAKVTVIEQDKFKHVADDMAHVSEDVQLLSRGLKTLEGSVASLAVQVDNRNQQLTATIEGVDAHLETVEQSQQTYDLHLETLDRETEQLRSGYHELYTTFQASIDQLDAKFDEYMGYVRNVSHTTISQGTRITQLETLVGQQRTMIEVALRILKDNQLEEIT